MCHRCLRSLLEMLTEARIAANDLSTRLIACQAVARSLGRGLGDLAPDPVIVRGLIASPRGTGSRRGGQSTSQLLRAEANAASPPSASSSDTGEKNIERLWNEVVRQLESTRDAPCTEHIDEPAFSPTTTTNGDAT